jgi:hypothetical protein
MTPEELNRKIEFIVDSQARLAAAQEHDWLRQNGEFQQQVLDLQRQALHLLNLILGRLPSAWPPPAPG